MMKLARKLTKTVSVCPASLVSMVWISDGTCMAANRTVL
jgi:hypothetical protein